MKTVPCVWVVEEELYPKDWRSTAYCHFEFKSARVNLTYCRTRHPQVKFRLRKYIRSGE